MVGITYWKYMYSDQIKIKIKYTCRDKNILKKKICLICQIYRIPAMAWICEVIPSN